LPRVFSYTANSRYVSKVYTVKYPVENWENAVFSLENSESVENFIQAIIGICEKEKIDLIYPSNDFTAFIFSKHQNRFLGRGIKIPVPQISLLRNIVDKYRITKLAERENIPCPGTFLVINPEEFEKGVMKLGFPAILKWRFGSGSREVKFVDKDNYESIRRSIQIHGERHYILQEFIPGKEMVYIRVYANQSHLPIAESYVRNKRPELRIFQGRGISEETIEPPEIAGKIRDFFKNIEYIGYGHVQLKRDARNEKLKFLELNFRISQGTWGEMALGFNAPLVNYNLFYARDYNSCVYNKPPGVVFLYPVQDAVIFFKYLLYLFRKYAYNSIPPLSWRKNPYEKLPLLSELIHDFNKRYISLQFSQRKYDIFFVSLRKDPLVSLAYWLDYVYSIFKKKYPHEF